jgi:glucan phosphoethanolaminetransferase (alkaline phosphatase superfamily)
LKKILFNSAFAAWLTGFFVFLQQRVSEQHFLHAWQEGDIPVLFSAFFILTTIAKRSVGVFLLILVHLLFLTEVLHFLYYGHRINPSEIYRFFRDFQEVADGLSGSLWKMFIPWIGIMSFFLALHVYFFVKFFSDFIKIPYIGWLFLAGFGILVKNAAMESTPGRPGLQNQNFIRSSTETLASFLGNYLPMTFRGITSGGKEVPVPARIPPTDASVLFIIGESMAASHLSAMGYSLPTTPELKKLAESRRILLKKVLVSGTNTEISLLNFFFFLDTLQQFGQLHKGEHLLFRLSRQSGFINYYLSTQSLKGGSYILGYMDQKYIDCISLPHHRDPKLSLSEPQPDSCILPVLDTILKNPRKKCIFLQLYGCHEPYNERYPPEFAQKLVTKDENHTIHYDRAMLYQDYLLKKIFDKCMSQSSTPLYVFFLPDHGECAGDEGVFGHNMFRKPVLLVPFVYFTVGKEYGDTLWDYFDHSPFLLTQKQINVALRRLLGFDYKYYPVPYSTVIGMDYMGHDGHVMVKTDSSDIREISDIR